MLSQTILLQNDLYSVRSAYVQQVCCSFCASTDCSFREYKSTFKEVTEDYVCVCDILLCILVFTSHSKTLKCLLCLLHHNFINGSSGVTGMIKEAFLVPFFICRAVNCAVHGWIWNITTLCLLSIVEYISRHKLIVWVFRHHSSFGCGMHGLKGGRKSKSCESREIAYTCTSGHQSL